MGKTPYFERYLAGEHVAVWSELVELRDQVYAEPLHDDALAVCGEIVRRAHANLVMLHERLLALGYEFAEPDAALVEATPEAIAELDQLEHELGTLPLIARVWYETLASVNFSQADQQRVCKQSVEPPAGPEIFGLGSHPVLIVQRLDLARSQLQQMTAEDAEHREQVRQSGAEFEFEYIESGMVLPTGGWASNCEPKGFPLACRGIDGTLYNDGGGDTIFVEELRRAFAWGGFPFWQWAFKQRRFYSPFEYRPNFEKLLPLLKEGLLEL